MKTNEVLENIKARRSVRAYTGQQVLEEDLQAILEAAGSSSNLVVISFLFQLSSSFLILLKVVDMFAF